MRSEHWRAYRSGLGPRGLSMRPSPDLLDDLDAAARRGWTMRELAQCCLMDWPPNPRSASALIRVRLADLSAMDPPAQDHTPSPPAWRNPYDRPGSPIPPDIKRWMRGQRWWRDHPGEESGRT